MRSHEGLFGGWSSGNTEAITRALKSPLVGLRAWLWFGGFRYLVEEHFDHRPAEPALDQHRIVVVREDSRPLNDSAIPVNMLLQPTPLWVGGFIGSGRGDLQNTKVRPMAIPTTATRRVLRPPSSSSRSPGEETAQYAMNEFLARSWPTTTQSDKQAAADRRHHRLTPRSIAQQSETHRRTPATQ